jgi:hypothetical protein
MDVLRNCGHSSPSVFLDVVMLLAAENGPVFTTASSRRALCRQVSRHDGERNTKYTGD